MSRYTKILIATTTSFLVILLGCKYETGTNTSPLLKSILNFQRGLNVQIQVGGITLTCDTDTPNVTTKKITGKVKDTTTLSAVPDARITTTPSTNITLSDSEGNFSISGIDSTVLDITISVTANGYETLSSSVKLSCQNSLATILMDKVKVAATGVNAFTLDTSTLDNGNIQ